MTTTTTRDGLAVKPNLLPSLTSLRFFVAVTIFLFHATGYVLFTSPQVGKNLLDLVTMGGWAGMSFFFMLSGFVLTWVSRPGDSTLTFWRRRLVRVFPNHLLMFGVTAILGATVLGAVFDGTAAVFNVLLLQAWSPDLNIRIGFNSVSWSLSAELLFYASFPVLYRLISRIRPERLWAWTAGMLAVITLVVPVGVHRFAGGGEVIPFLELTQKEFWLLFHFPPVRMLEFVTGILLARIVLTGRRVPVSFGGAAAVTVALYALGPHFPPHFRMVAVMAVPMALLIAAGAVSDLHRERTTLLSSRPMVYLGNLSYAFYLVHMQVLVFGAHWLGTGTTPGGTAYGFAVIALLFAVAVGLSWLMFNLLEQPMMRRFGAKPKARRTVSATAPTAVPAPADGPADEAPRTPATAGRSTAI
ncbi:acyltransferase [Streptomyces sp. NPDC097619]|uniref:acyltransferase family protein n=1 Tax=Streptomyces sp. NPDC097619 TaxID=3157228 RepID=UPI00332C4322